MKKMILVTSPPACGKTLLSKKIATAVDGIVYLDKDTLIPLSKQIFKVAGEPYNRSSDFFEREIRDLEYDVILDLGMEALEYNDNVLINAPFTREIRDEKFIASLKERLKEAGAVLCSVWIVTDVEVIHQRMIERNSDRDSWKLENWDEYISKINFEIPTLLKEEGREDSLIIYRNSTDEMAAESFKELINIISK